MPPKNESSPGLALSRKQCGETYGVRTSSCIANGYFNPSDETLVKFLGIPFAEPVDGENSFRPPKPLKLGQCPDVPDTRDCSHFGEASPQPLSKRIGGLLGVPVEEDLGKMGSQCLNLNIVTHKDGLSRELHPSEPPPKDPRPVIVWVHGGANATGSNAQLGHFYPADWWAKQGVVCVSINYRLALHGFLHLPEQGVTNVALHDIVLALAWVRENIPKFGGNKDNVTVWGESSGAINISALLCSAKATGLFNKAVVMSGGCNLYTRKEYTQTMLPHFTQVLQTVAKAHKKQLRVHESGEPLLEDLQRLPHEIVSEASDKLKDPMTSVHGLHTSPTSFNAMQDGHLFPEDSTPLDALRAGSARGIAIIVGSNAREMTDFVGFIGEGIMGWFGRSVFGMLARWGWYPPLYPGIRLIAGRFTSSELPDSVAKAESTELRSQLSYAEMSDLVYTMAERQMARAAQQGGAKVYEYTLDLTPEEGGKAGSGHGVDVALLLGATHCGEKEQSCHLQRFFGRDALGEGVESLAVGLRDAMVRFAEGGTPVHFMDVEWQDNQRGEMVVSTTPQYQEAGEDGWTPRRRLLSEALERMRVKATRH
eukprot:Hpha_TRINITY_DN24090_c0_g1::TRINITY_DN24090_c0_g1_i1::g.130453::m.130453/K03929/pnbA; para-nitrobenzyl esterase